MTNQKPDHSRQAVNTNPVPPMLELTTTLSQAHEANDPEAPNPLQYGKTIPVLLDDLIQTRLLLQADSGGGKSHCIRYLMEQSYSVVPQTIIDIEGEFSTLREQFPYVLVSATPGEGDLRADPASAGPLCRKIAENGASVIIDLYDLDEPDQQLFVANYAAELLSLPKSMWTTSLVVIDEAERVAPEQGAAVSKTMISSLVKRARKRRIGVILAAQNLSDLSKKAARSLHNKMIGLATLDTDIRRSAAELGFDKDHARELSELEPGTFFAHGRAFPYRGVRLVRTGPVKTTHDPLSHQDTPPEAIQTPKTLNKVLADLATIEIPADTNSKTDSPSTAEAPIDENRLRREITAQLEKHYETELQRRLRENLDQRIQEATAHLQMQASDLSDSLEEARQHARNCLRSLETQATNRPNTSPENSQDHEKQRVEPMDKTQEEIEEKWDIDPDEIVRYAVVGDDHWSNNLSDANRSILEQLEFLHSHKVSSVDRRNLALLSGRSPRSSAYDDALAYLKKVGMVYYPEPGTVGITSHGRTIMTFLLNGEHSRKRFEAGKTLHELQREWLTYLGPSRSSLLQPLLEEYPSGMTRKELAVRSGRSSRSSAFDDALAQMRKIGLIEYPNPGLVRASSLLFPKGLS